MNLSGKVVATSMKSLFTHHNNILDMYNETGFIWYMFLVFSLLLMIAWASTTEIILWDVKKCFVEHTN